MALRPRGLWVYLTLIGATFSWFSSCSCSSRGGLDGKSKTLRLVHQGKGKSMDPHVQFDQYSSQVVVLLYDSLFTTHYLKRPLEFIPNLAASMPTFTDDGKTMTIKLRTDVKFQNGDCFPNHMGRKFGASDVVYSFTRFADPFVNANSYSLIEGLIVGLDDARKKMETLGAGKYKYDDFPVDGLKALDDQTIQVKLTRATLVPMQVMAKSIMSIVPRECVDKYGEDFAFHPLGTGPFKLKYFNRLGDLWLKKNSDYHMTYPTEGEPGDAEKGLLADAGKRLPLVDEIYAPVIEESQPAVLKFLRGYFDWIQIDAESFGRMATNSGPGKFEIKEQYKNDVNLYAAVDSSSYWLVLNMHHAILGKNVQLRRAMAMAINRPGFVADVLNGRGIVVDTVVPSALPSNHKDLGFSWYPYDVEKAKELMKEAGFPNGEGLPPFRFVYSTGATTQRLFEFYRRSLAQIGVKVILDSMPYASHIKKMESGDFDLTVAGWGADYPDPENFTALFTSASRAQGQNYGDWRNKRYDALSDLTKITPPGPERTAMFKEMAELVKQDVPLIPIYAAIRVGLTPKKWLHNFKRDLESERDPIHMDVEVESQKEGFSL